MSTVCARFLKLCERIYGSADNFNVSRRVFIGLFFCRQTIYFFRGICYNDYATILNNFPKSCVGVFSAYVIAIISVVIRYRNYYSATQVILSSVANYARGMAICRFA